MLKIKCPHCGTRDESEFNCGLESHISRPPLDADDEVWANYLYFRDNPKGVTFERWRHSFGCGLWFNVARDTASHRIASVYAINAPRPAVSE